MKNRDIIAGQVMVALIKATRMSAKQIARKAYEQADEMIEAAKVTGKEIQHTK